MHIMIEPDKLCGLSLNAWLEMADEGTGRLNRYHEAVKQNFDSVEQILALYLTRSRGGVFLHSQFFEDIDMCSMEDRELVQRAIVTNVVHSDIGIESKPNDECAYTTHENRLAPEALRCWSFAAWLRDVDCGGKGLLRYAEHLEENYDSVEQVVNLYGIEGSGDSGSLNHMFFGDVGIVDKHHKMLFDSWFSRKCLLPAVREYAPQHKFARSASPDDLQHVISENLIEAPCDLYDEDESKIGEGERSEGPCRRHRPDPELYAVFGSDFDKWLTVVGIPSGGPGSLFHQYKTALETSKWTPDVQTLVDRYLVPDHDSNGYGLDCQLFLEMGVHCVEHRRLLEDWLLQEEVVETPRLSPNSSPVQGAKHQGSDGVEILQESAGFFEQIDDESSELLHTTQGEALNSHECERGSADAMVTGCVRDWARCSSNNKYSGPDFEEWLLEVDASGSLLEKYPETLRELYDTPEQILRLYTVSATSVVWDPLFFEDANVPAAHVPLFQQWLMRKRCHHCAPEPTDRCKVSSNDGPAESRYRIEQTRELVGYAVTRDMSTVGSTALDRRYISEAFEVID